NNLSLVFYKILFFAPFKGASLALQAYLGSLVILGLGLNCLQFIANSLLLGVGCNKIFSNVI
ncbi:hypothetical protein ACTVG0_001811, partial [Campylobacter coli]